MYKLICNNISKSKGSLTSFTSPCKKVAHNYETHARTKDYVSESDIGRRDKTDEPARVGSDTQMKSTSYNSFFTEEMKAASLTCPLLEVRKTSQGVRTISYSSAPHKYFCSSLVEQGRGSSAKKKTFKNKEAVEMYRNALEQCNKIKCDRYRMGSIYKSASWFPRPIKPGYSWEEKEEAEDAEKEGIVLENKQEEAKQPPRPTMKRVIHVFQDRRHISAPLNKEIENICQRKPNHQFKNRKVRITYPTHTVNYKIGLNKPYYLDQLSSHLGEIPTYEDVTKVRNNAKGVSPADTMQVKYKSQPNLALLMKLKAPVENRDQPAEQRIERDVDEPLMKKHPTVEKGGRMARMAMSNKYSQLLSKIFTKNQDKSRQETIVEDKESRDNSLEELTKGGEEQEPPDAYTEPKMTKHPLVVNKAQDNLNIPLKYPKRVIVEKPETFDIEGTCIKHKGASSKYGDYIIELDKKAQSHTLSKEEETVTAEAEEFRDQLNNLPEIEEIKCEEQKAEKVPTPAESLAEYLKKLKQLKEQTAKDRISIIQEPTLVEPSTKDIGERVKIPGETIKTDVAKKIEEKRNRINDQMRTEHVKENEGLEVDDMAEVLYKKPTTNKELRTADKRKANLQSLVPPQGTRSREVVKELVKKQRAAKQKARKIVYPAEDTSMKNIKLTLPRSQDITKPQEVPEKMLEEDHKSEEPADEETLQTVLDEYKLTLKEVVEPKNEEMRLDTKNIKDKKERKKKEDKPKPDKPPSGMTVNIKIPSLPEAPLPSPPKKQKQPEPKPVVKKKHRYELSEYVRPVENEVKEKIETVQTLKEPADAVKEDSKVLEPSTPVEAKLEKTDEVKNVKATSKPSDSEQKTESKVKKMEYRSKSMVSPTKTKKPKEEMKQVQELKETTELSGGSLVKKAKSEGSLEDILTKEREEEEGRTSIELEEKTATVIEATQLDSEQFNVEKKEAKDSQKPLREDTKQKSPRVEAMKKVRFPSESIKKTIQRDTYTKLKEAGQRLVEAISGNKEQPSKTLEHQEKKETIPLEESKPSEKLMTKTVDNRQKGEQSKIGKLGGSMAATGDGNQNRSKGKPSPRVPVNKMEAKDADNKSTKEHEETKAGTKRTAKKQETIVSEKTKETPMSLENRPVIRRPEPISKDRPKKDKPKTKKDMILPPRVHTKAETRPEEILLEDLTKGAKILDTLAAEYMSKCRSLAEILDQQKKEMLEDINKKLETRSDSDLLKKDKLDDKQASREAAEEKKPSDEVSYKPQREVKPDVKEATKKIAKAGIEYAEAMKKISGKAPKEQIQEKHHIKAVGEQKKVVEAKKEVTKKETVAENLTKDDQTSREDAKILSTKKTESKDLVPQTTKDNALLKLSEDEHSITLTNIDNEPTTPADKDHKEMAISIANQKKNKKLVKKLNATSNATTVGLKNFKYEQGKPHKIIEKSPRIEKGAKETERTVLEDRGVPDVAQRASMETSETRKSVDKVVIAKDSEEKHDLHLQKANTVIKTKEMGKVMTKTGVDKESSKKSVLNLSQRSPVAQIPRKPSKIIETDTKKTVVKHAKTEKTLKKPFEKTEGGVKYSANIVRKPMPTLNVVVKLNSIEKQPKTEEPKKPRKIMKLFQKEPAKDEYKTWFQKTALGEKIDRYKKQKAEIKDAEKLPLKVVVKLNPNQAESEPKIEETIDEEPNIDADFEDKTIGDKTVEEKNNLARNTRSVLDFIYGSRKENSETLETTVKSTLFKETQQKIKKGSVIDSIYERDIAKAAKRPSVLDEIYAKKSDTSLKMSTRGRLEVSATKSSPSLLEQIYGKQPPTMNKETRMKNRPRSLSLLDSIYGDEYDLKTWQPPPKNNIVDQYINKTEKKSIQERVYSSRVPLKFEVEHQPEVKKEAKEHEKSLVSHIKPISEKEETLPEYSEEIQAAPTSNEENVTDTEKYPEVIKKMSILNHIFARRQFMFEVEKKQDVKKEMGDSTLMPEIKPTTGEQQVESLYRETENPRENKIEDDKISFSKISSKKPLKLKENKKEENQIKSLVTDMKLINYEENEMTTKPPKTETPPESKEEEETFLDISSKDALKLEEKKKEVPIKSLVTDMKIVDYQTRKTKTLSENKKEEEKSFLDISSKQPLKFEDKKKDEALNIEMTPKEVTPKHAKTPSVTASKKEEKKKLESSKVTSSVTIEKNVTPHITSSKEKKETKPKEHLSVKKDKDYFDNHAWKKRVTEKGEDSFTDITDNLMKELQVSARNANMAKKQHVEAKKSLDKTKQKNLSPQLRVDKKDTKPPEPFSFWSEESVEDEVGKPLRQPPRYNQIVKKKPKSIDDEPKPQSSRKKKTSSTKPNVTAKTKHQVVEKKDVKPDVSKSMKEIQGEGLKEDQTKQKVVAPKPSKGSPRETSKLVEKKVVKPDITKTGIESPSIWTIKEDQTTLPFTEAKPVTKEKEIPPKIFETQDSLKEKKAVEENIQKSASQTQNVWAVKEDPLSIPVTEVKPVTEEEEILAKTFETQDQAKEKTQAIEELVEPKSTTESLSFNEEQTRLLVAEVKPAIEEKEEAPKPSVTAQSTEKQTENKEEQETNELSSRAKFRLEKMQSLEELMKIKLDKKNQEDNLAKAGKKQKVIIQLTREPSLLMMLAKGQPFVSKSRSKTSPSIQKTSPDIQKTSPKIEKTSPNIQKTSPKIEKTSPKTEKTSPPKIEKTLPNIQKTVTKPRDNKVEQQKKLIELQKTLIYKNEERAKIESEIREVNQLLQREKALQSKGKMANNEVLKNEGNATTSEKNVDKSKPASAAIQCSPNMVERQGNKESEETKGETRGKKGTVPYYSCSTSDLQKKISHTNTPSGNKPKTQQCEASTSLSMNSAERADLTVVESYPSLKPVRAEEVAACYYKYLAEDLLHTKLSKHLATRNPYRKSDTGESEFLRDLGKNEVPNFFRKYVLDEQIRSELAKYLSNTVYFQKAMIGKEPAMFRRGTMKKDDEKESTNAKKKQADRVRKTQSLPTRVEPPKDVGTRPKRLNAAAQYIAEQAEQRKFESYTSRQRKQISIIKQVSYSKPSIRNCSIFIEKNLPNKYRDEKKEKKAPKQTIAYCERICIPPRTLSKMAFKQNIQEATTLNRIVGEKTVAFPIKSSDKLNKYKKIKIMHMIIRRPAKNSEEHFLPAVLRSQSNEFNLGKNEDSRPRVTRSELIDLRYKLLQKLYKEFNSLPEQKKNKLTGNFKEVSKHYERTVNDLKSGKTDLEKFDIDLQKEICDVHYNVPSNIMPRNSTELLIKKLQQEEAKDKKLKELNEMDNEFHRDKDDDDKK